MSQYLSSFTISLFKSYVKSISHTFLYGGELLEFQASAEV
jgi:hypothetical protein